MIVDDLGLRPDQRDLVEDILRWGAPRPSRVWAFGSRVKGRARTYSDLDLAVDAGRPLTLGDSAKLSDAFEESTLPWRVDLVDLVTCSETFRAEVQSHAVLLLDVSAEPAAKKS